jgi:hypothetical protein
MDPAAFAALAAGAETPQAVRSSCRVGGTGG